MQEEVVVMGDMNEHTGMLCEHMNQNEDMFVEFACEVNLENLHEPLVEGRVTWRARDQASAIGDMLVNGNVHECVSRM